MYKLQLFSKSKCKSALILLSVFIFTLLIFAFLFTSCTGDNGSLPEESGAAGTTSANTDPDTDREGTLAGDSENTLEGDNEGEYVPVPPKSFLLENGIELTYNTIEKKQDNWSININYPTIRGLLDKDVQDRINNEIKLYADNFATLSLKDEEEFENETEKDNKATNEDGKSPTKDKAVSGNCYRWLGISMMANYNNVICLLVNGMENNGTREKQYIDSMVFELINGTRITLADVFADGADYMKILNNNVALYLIRENMDEEVLSKPFGGIKQNQSFFFTESSVVIIIDENTPGFEIPNRLIYINFVTGHNSLQ